MSTGSEIGMAANIVGGELQGWAALLDKWAMQKSYQDEATRQAAFRDQAMQGPVQLGLKQSTPTAMMAGVGQGAAMRNQAYSDIAKVPLGTGFSRESHYNPTADDAYTNMIGGARANLGGYSDWGVQQAINNIRNQQRLNQISNFAGGQSRNVFPLEMYASQHSNDDLAAIGQAISSIGGAAGNYAQLYATQPTQTQAPSYVNSGSPAGPSLFSGYGGAANYPPMGTSYNPYTDQNTIGFGGGWISG